MSADSIPFDPDIRGGRAILALLCLTLQFLMTIKQRREPPLYVSLYRLGHLLPVQVPGWLRPGLSAGQ
jgi:hypothetical protein